MCTLEAVAPADTGYEFEGSVCGRIELFNTGESISAQGRLEAMVVLNCSRCLRAHGVPLNITVDEICSLDPIGEPESGARDSEGNRPIPIHDGEAVELRELMRQLLILNVPPRSLCQPDCLGLCPQCGQNLNESRCPCQPQQLDPRLAPLQKLLP